MAIMLSTPALEYSKRLEANRSLVIFSYVYDKCQILAAGAFGHQLSTIFY